MDRFTPQPYRRASFDTPYDVIVIGSGAGGMTTAVLLALHAGKRVLILERHYTAGGFTHSFRRPGFDWDVGVHYIGQVQNPVSETRRMFDHLTEGRLQWSPMPAVYDRMLIADRAYDFPEGVESFRERMQSYFPRDRRAIDRYIEAVDRCVRRMGLFFAEKVVPPLISSALGGLLRYPYLRYAARTTSDVMKDFTTNQELIGVLTGQWGDYGLPPGQSSFGIHAVIAKHYFDGGSYPVGGAGEILASMAPIVERHGGAVVINAEVDSIIVEEGAAVGVRMADGRDIRARVIVSDAGAANTYNRMLQMSSPSLDAIRGSIATIPPSISHLCLYVGLDGSADQLRLEGTNLWVYPTANHDENVRRFFADPSCELPAVYISFPSAKDPEFLNRHPGHSTIDVITFAPYDWFTRWDQTHWRRRGEDYEDFKRDLHARLLDVLYRHVPAARDRVIHAELSTPLTTRHFTNHAHGEIYGLAHTPERFQTRALGPRTPVRNLYISGQDAAICGVTGAIAGGVLAASAILGRNMFSVVTKKKQR